MSDLNFSEKTLTDSQASAIIEAFRFVFPDFAKDGSPYIEKKVFRDDKNINHKALFVFGNLIFFDEVRDCFVVRRLADGPNSLGELHMEDDSTHKDIISIIKRIIQRQLECRLSIFFGNEVDDDGTEIPFSSRYECAIHGRKHKEYGFD